jgi:Molybdopterin-binding domain of aldehyde dehydrogenase/Aldehyde oxidase and xanthine dehydrogenase, a/b hammerhead domain/Carbon monoxide dehydrogenase subunit G (CoxG)
MTTQAAPPAGRVTGQPVRRKEDARVITGQARWTDNLTLPGLAHLAIVRSPMAHARIGKADVSAALERPGVVAAFTGRDLASDYGSLPTAWIVSDDLIVPDHPPIAADEARYLGDAVAVVVAEDPYQAADAAEAVQVEYEPLPAVVDPAAALADGAPLVHAGQATNRAFTWTFSGGDYAAARRRATVVVSRRFVQQRVMPTAMEPRAVLAEPFPATGEFTLWTSTQVPHFVRLLMSSVCGIGEQKLRVIAADVGGGFGGKLNVYAEEAIALAVAGRPEATFAVERIMDELAAELGLDPLELRQRNWISHDEFPYTTVTGLTYDSGNYEAATARAAELFGYDALRREQAERRQLLDVERSAPCMPGATVERVDGDEVAGRVRVKVGPVTASYAGTARFVTKDEAAHRFVLEGSGRETRGTGTASRDGRGQHERAGRRYPGAGGHLARGDRQAGAVRPRRDGRHRGQADRSVRRMPGRTSARSRPGGGTKRLTPGGLTAGGLTSVGRAPGRRGRVAGPGQHRRHARAEAVRPGARRRGVRAHPRPAPWPSPPDRDHDRGGAAGWLPARANRAVRTRE